MSNPLAKFFGPGEPGQTTEVDVRSISPNPYQPRRAFQEDEIRGLAQSIEEHGLLQPILVRPYEGGYQVVAGERRLRALQMLKRKRARVIIREVEDREMAQIALVENLQRKDLNFFEEAVGYQTLLENFNMTQGELAQKIGRSQPMIANKLRLLRLAYPIREKIIEAGLGERHARALLPLRTVESQEAALKEAVAQGYSVKETEKMVEKMIKREKEKQEGKKQGQIIKVFEDMRLYVNTIRKTVKEMKEWGVDIKLEEVEEDEYISFYIKLPKRKRAEG